MKEIESHSAEHAVKQAFEALGGVQRSDSVTRWIQENYPNRWEDKFLRNRIRCCSVNYPKAISYDPDFPHFLYRQGTGRYELYDPERHGLWTDEGYSLTSPGLGASEELRELAAEIDGRNEFAYESHLRDYLAKDLRILEEGLSLWSDRESSIEYYLEGRRIDILARDRDGVPVIIELKLSRGHERTIGQALYYRGKLRKILDVNRVRIIMIASEISEELRIASSEIADVKLFSYELTMRVHPVSEESK